MAGKAAAFENDYLKLVFNNVAIALIGDANGLQPSATAGSLYLSLHTADPTDSGNQTSNEISYTGYARVAVARNSGGWTVSNNTAVLAANADFPASTGGTGGIVTHFAIGTSSTGTGKILYSGTCTPNITVSSGVTPRLTTGTTVTEN